MTRTEKWKEKRELVKKQMTDLDEYFTNLELENDRLKEENELLKKMIEIDDIAIKFMKDMVDYGETS